MIYSFIALLMMVLFLAPIVLLGIVLNKLNQLNIRVDSIARRLELRPAAATVSHPEPAEVHPETSRDADSSPLLRAAPAPQNVSPVRQDASPSPPELPKQIRTGTRRSRRLTEAGVGQRGLLVAGIMILLLGLGFFLQYSFQQGWISPLFRVVLVYLAGFGLLGTAEFFRRRFSPTFALPLAGAGCATLYFATYAAYGLYDLLAAAAAFPFMIAVTVLTGTLAIHYRNQWLAVLGLVGGFLTPILIRAEEPATAMLFFYLLILNFGVLAVAWFRKWNLLNYLGMAATWLVFSAWFTRHYEGEVFWLTLVFLNLYFLIHALAPVLYQLRHQIRGVSTEWIIAIPNAAFALGFGFSILQRQFSAEAAGVLTLAYSAFYTAFAAWSRRHRPDAAEAFTLHLVMAMVFLGLTVPALFSGPWITFFWALLAGAFAWASWRLNHFWIYLGGLAAATFALIRLYLFEYPLSFEFSGWRHGFAEPWMDQAPVRILLPAAIAAALILLRVLGPRVSRIPRSLLKGISFFCGLHLLVFLSVETRSLFLQVAPGAADAALSCMWALFSMALMGLGFRMRKRSTRLIAIALFGATAFKVLVVDMAEAATPFRILSSVLVGIVLIAASFLYHYFKERIDSDADPL